MQLGCNSNIPMEYVRAYEYIAQDDEELKKIFSEINNLEPFSVYENYIPFNTVTVAESVLSKDYIKEYSIFMELTASQKMIEESVMDSLQLLESKANKNYNATFKEASDFRDHSRGELIILFSHLYDNLLFAEVIRKEGIKLGYTKAQGEGLTYLFVFDEENNIIEVYKGSIHHN